MDKFLSSLEGDSPVLQALGEYGYKAYENREMYIMYVHLIAAALFPIFIGSHASLHRPPSAKAAPKRKGISRFADEDDDDLVVEPSVEGLSPSDAVLFPVLAGITLGALYFVIKVLKNAAILNKILGWYFSTIGIFGVGKLAADTLNVATSFVFPAVWASSTTTYYIDPFLSLQVAGEVKPARTQVHRKVVDKTNPFPGLISSIQFPSGINKSLWSIRALLKKHWILRAHIHGIFSTKSKIQFNDVIGLLIGIASIIAYNLASKPWWLTNLIGFGFCYGTLQIMSPTTFWTGSLVLTGLFFYDITMVFYTPLMVTVATQLDVPIKLVFPGPKRGSMLGLGDVVLPGIMMALALRFDLYLHYHNLSKSTAAAANNLKATYLEATGTWGDRFWTRNARQPLDSEITSAEGGRFKKIYFTASVVGYVIAMLTTLVVLNVYNHAQPALLYLVPGVLIAIWGTAAVRGEWSLMWGYTEDGSLEGPEEEKKVPVEGAAAEEKSKEHAHHVFLFSLSEPKSRNTVAEKTRFVESSDARLEKMVFVGAGKS